MAITVTNQSTPLGAKIVNDTTVGNTAVINVTGAAGVIYYVEIDNTANAAVSYLKVYDTGTVTVGTTPPDWIFRAYGSANTKYVIPTDVNFATALSYCCVTTAGDGGTASPASAVAVRFVTS